MNEFYNNPNQARDLAASYNALSFESVHGSWSKHWPKPDARVLDIGAGSGRDARWLANQGCEVFAVEPSNALRELGMQHTQSHDVTWLSDTLPALKHTLALGIRFDLILVSAVWMHIPQSQRDRAMCNLSNLLSANGELVITLRHGEFDDGRVSHGVSLDELSAIGANNHVIPVLATTDEDQLERADVWWQTMVLRHYE